MGKQNFSMLVTVNTFEGLKIKSMKEKSFIRVLKILK